MPSVLECGCNPRLSRDLLQNVEGSIRQQLGTRVLGFRLENHENGIALHGQSRNYHAKQVALHLTMQAIGLPIVANYIQVQ